MLSKTLFLFEARKWLLLSLSAVSVTVLTLMVIEGKKNHLTNSDIRNFKERTNRYSYYMLPNFVATISTSYFASIRPHHLYPKQVKKEKAKT